MSLEQDADKVILLHRESYYKKDMEDDPTLELIIPKNRQGAVGTKYLNFFRNIQLICERIK